MRQRERIVPSARGRVLEVGIGSGLNLPFYNADEVTKVWGLDPSPEITRLAENSARKVAFDVEFLQAGAEAIPLETGSMDTVLITYTLCTIPDPEAALSEMARVLKKGGQFLFCEHGVAPDESIRRWQNRLNPAWKKLGGGCNLNRNIPGLIRGSGFEIVALHAKYMPGWRPASFNYWGTAAPR